MRHPIFSALAALALMILGWSYSLADGCAALPKASQLTAFLTAAPGTGGDAGGLFHGNRMWAAVVDRDGTLCAFAPSTSDPTQVWPGSQAIAKAKASTANAFTLDTLA